MRGAGIPSVLPSSTLGSLPITLEQTSSRSSPILMIAVLGPLSLALLMPFLLVAQHLAQDPASRAVIAERPQAAIQLLIALAFCGALFGWPLVRLARALGRGRSIEIDRGTVAVTERSLGGARAWSEPLAKYTGVSHHVRASLSGLRQELTLVHPDPSRSVLLAISDRIPQEEIDRVASLLDVAEIPSPEAYSLALMRGTLGPAGPKPRLGVARA